MHLHNIQSFVCFQKVNKPRIRKYENNPDLITQIIRQLKEFKLGPLLIKNHLTQRNSSNVVKTLTPSKRIEKILSFFKFYWNFYLIIQI